MDEQSIFLEALETRPAERDEFLKRSCGGDTALRQRVESLLRSHETGGPFLQTPVLEQSANHHDTPAGIDPTVVSGETARRDESLDFLAPSQRPDSLGRLGHYEVLQLVGRGGMGLVLRAFDEKLHRVVALKVVSRGLANSPMARKRFIREAQAAAAISHDNVVHIHAVEDEGPVPYLVMQYVEGQSLDDLLKQEGSLELKQVLRIGLQIAAGLAAAHKQGKIHRDIKPANILLENGVQRVKITDFGLARAIDDATITQSGLIAGTPQYMSPEQAQGDAIDARSDLFSLGSVMYAMCAGRPPFRANNTVAVLRRVCDDTPRPLTELNPEIPAWLCQIIDKLLAKQPADRYQSAREVADVLTERLAQLQLPAPTADREVQPNAERRAAPASDAATTIIASPARKRRWPRVAAGLLLATAVVVAAIILIQTDQGTFVIETDDPTISISVTKTGAMLKDGSRNQYYHLKVARHDPRTGEYDLEVTNPAVFTTKTFTIKRGQKVAVKAWFKPADDLSATFAHLPWVPLFNGKDLSGWKMSRDQPGKWRLVDGALVGTGPGSHLFTERGDYESFHLRVEAKVNDDANAGVWFRTRFGLPRKLEWGLNVPDGYEADILTNNSDWKTGSLTRLQSYTSELIKPNEWFTLEVIADGSRIQLKVNGTTTVSFDDRPSSWPQGHIALQALFPGTVLHVRKIEIRQSPVSASPTPPNPFGVADVSDPSSADGRPASPAPLAASAAGFITDYRETHGADRAQLDAWLERTEREGFLPSTLSAWNAADGPRFNAIAVTPGNKVPWKVTHSRSEAEDKQGNLEAFHQSLREGLHPRARAAYWLNEQRWTVTLWTKASTNVWGAHTGSRKLTDEKLAQMRTAGTNRPTSVSATSAPNQLTQFSHVQGANDGVPWEVELDLTPQGLADQLNAYALKGWYLYDLSAYQVGGLKRFVALWLENRDNLRWTADPKLDAAGLERELAAKKLAQMRPMRISGYEENGQTYYAVVWLAYRPGTPAAK